MPDAPAGEIAREQDLDARLGSLDLGLFAPIGLPGWASDPVSLLALHSACREAYGSFAYLEIGSYLGSSLQSFVADPQCRTVMSIDPRPPASPDDRWATAHYPDNTTENMLAHLASVPGADLTKVHPFEADATDVDPRTLPDRPALCFVDGEHTYDAALADARFCREAVEGEGTIVFHDRAVVAAAIAQFVRELERDGVAFFAYALPSALFVVELGSARLARTSAVSARLAGPSGRLWTYANRGRRPSRRIALFLSAEARARRSAPPWAKRVVRAVLRPKNGGAARGPSGVAGST